MDKKLWKKRCTAAYGYSYTRLALNYYTYVDSIVDGTAVPDLSRQVDQDWNNLIRCFMKDTLTLEDVGILRKKLLSQMEVLTAYTDAFQIYEYVLNRMERRFHKNVFPVHEEGLVEELVEFLTDAEDPMVLKRRIQEVLGELPVRLTKQKFFSIVSEWMSVFTGKSKAGLDQMMYILKTQAMLLKPEDMKTGCEEAYELLERMKKFEYKAMTAEIYETALKTLEQASDLLNGTAHWCMMLTEMVNDLYVVLLTETSAMTELADKENLKMIFEGLLEAYDDESCEMLPDELSHRLIRLEGKQEASFEKYQSLAAVGEEDMDPEAVISRQIDCLLSDSIFVSLEEAKMDMTLVDQAMLEQTLQQFFEELESLFHENPKPVIRAVMAKTLSALPACFHTVGEIRTFISGSLESCADLCERETCVELLQNLMESEYALV